MIPIALIHKNEERLTQYLQQNCKPKPFTLQTLTTDLFDLELLPRKQTNYHNLTALSIITKIPTWSLIFFEHINHHIEVRHQLQWYTSFLKHSNKIHFHSNIQPNIWDKLQEHLTIHLLKRIQNLNTKIQPYIDQTINIWINLYENRISRKEAWEKVLKVSQKFWHLQLSSESQNNRSYITRKIINDANKFLAVHTHSGSYFWGQSYTPHLLYNNTNQTGQQITAFEIANQLQDFYNFCPQYDV